MTDITRNIRIIGAPFHSGTDRNGTQYAPQYLKKMILAYNYPNIIDGGNISEVEEDTLNESISCGVKNLKLVCDICNKLKHYVSEHYCPTDELLLALGGDHSIALGTIAGILENDSNIGVIWFDAHTDINTETTTPSKKAHGMPVAALLGLCSSKLNDIPSVKLKKQNLFYIGARDIDEGEQDILKRLNIKVYGMDKVHKLGMEYIMNEIRETLLINEVTNTHISFDIDGMDPSIVNATGTKVSDGLTETHFVQFAHCLRLLPKISSIDFVEYNPLLDKNDQTLNWCDTALKELIKNTL